MDRGTSSGEANVRMALLLGNVATPHLKIPSTLLSHLAERGILNSTWSHRGICSLLPQLAELNRGSS